MDKSEHLWFFFRFLQEVEEGMSKEEEKRVMIEKVINLRLMCDYVVSCSYGDVVLIICMLHDYVKMLDESRSDDIVYHAYYRKKFTDMADRLAKQINYDYDKALEKCLKNHQKEERDSDIGEDGLTQMVRQGFQAAEKKEKGERKWEKRR